MTEMNELIMRMGDAAIEKGQNISWRWPSIDVKATVLISAL